MTRNPLAIKAEQLGVRYEGSVLAWALFHEIQELKAEIENHVCSSFDDLLIDGKAGR